MSSVRTGQLTYGQLSVLRSMQGYERAEQSSANGVNIWPVPAGVSRPAVTSAWRCLVRRHESLRTCYRLDSGELGQVVLPEPGDDLASLPLAEPTEAAAQRLAAGPLDECFELESSVPYSAFIATYSGAPRFLVTVMHHVAVDGIARIVLESQFADALAGRPAPDPLAPVDLAAEQRTAAGGARRVAYWTQVWDGLQEADRQGDDRSPRVVAEIYSERGLAAARAIAAEFGVSVQAAVLGVCALALGRRSGRDRTSLALMAANRFKAHWADIVTSMNQLAPVTLSAAPERDVGEYLRETFVHSLDAYRNACYDLDEVHQAVTRNGHANPDPMNFDIYYNFLGSIDEVPAADDPVATAIGWRPMSSTSGPGLSLYIGIGSGLLVTAKASQDYLPGAQAGQFLAAVEAGLVSLATDRPARLGGVRLDPLRPVTDPPVPD